MVLSTSPRSALRPLRAATTASADFSLAVRHRHPFRRKARSPRARTHSFAAQPPHLRRPRLDHESFAVSCPLALRGFAFYAVLVHRLAASLHASSPHSVALMQLRFATLVVISLRRDSHPQECARAGRTKQKAARRPLFASSTGHFFICHGQPCIERPP